jgi:hypothetical protein
LKQDFEGESSEHRYDGQVLRDSKPLVFRNPDAEVEIALVADALVTVEGDHATRVIDVFVYDSRLAAKRSLGHPEGILMLANSLGAAAGSGRVFNADHLGIMEFNLDGRPPARVGGLPDLPMAPELEQFAIRGPGNPEGKRQKPLYCWLMHPDEAGNRLFAHSSRSGSHHHLVEIDLRQRTITSTIQLLGFTHRIALSTRHSIVVLSNFEAGAEIRDLRGDILARVPATFPISEHHAGWDSGRLSFAIRPTDGVVAIGSPALGIWLWDWRSHSATRLTDHGHHPAWSPDGTTLYFMRTAAQLWRITPDGHVEPIAQAFDETGGTEDQRKSGWEMPPLVSPDGRFVLARMTLQGVQAARHSGVVFETSTGHIHQAPGFFAHSLCWV